MLTKQRKESRRVIVSNNGTLIVVRDTIPTKVLVIGD